MMVVLHLTVILMWLWKDVNTTFYVSAIFLKEVLFIYFYTEGVEG